MSKKTIFHSLFLLKCPRCRNGDLFSSSITENKGIYAMNDHCLNCQQDFQIEPGFYWGAMYMGYGLISGYFLIVTTLIYIYSSLSLYASFGVSITIGLLALPYVARLSRSIWIHIFVRYDKKRGIIIDMTSSSFLRYPLC